MEGKLIANIKCKHCVSVKIHVSCDMFLVTFSCADIMNVSQAKITLKLILSLSFIFCMLQVQRNINQILFVSRIARCFMKWLHYVRGRFQITLDIMQI